MVDGFVPHKQQSIVSKSVYELVRSSVAQICKVNQQPVFVLDEVDDTIVARTTALFGFLVEKGSGVNAGKKKTMLFRGTGWKYLDLSGFDKVVIIKEPELQLMKTSQVTDMAALQKARAYENLCTVESIKVILTSKPTEQSEKPNVKPNTGYLITVTK